MREDREHAEAERSEGQEETEGAPEPFDQNPPVNPSEPQVGNSRARFFMPREENEGAENQEEEEEVREGDA